MVKVLQALHLRDARRPFCPPNHWLSTDPLVQQASDLLAHISAGFGVFFFSLEIPNPYVVVSLQTSLPPVVR
jgi:hypothetical protein